MIGFFILTGYLSCLSQGFSQITFDAGVIFSHSGTVFGNGISFADFTDDGLDDISLAGNQEDPVFYRNSGDGTFILLDLGISGEGGDMKSLQWVDFDNDGDKDLFLSKSFIGISLYEKTADGNLVDISEAAGLSEYATRYYGSSWGDYDNDGWLDLYVCNYYNAAITEGYAFENHLYHNNQDGTFSDVTIEAGVSDGVKPSFQSAWLDYDEDGDQDLFVINDRDYASNTLFQNQGDGTFIDVTVESGWENYSDTMCFAAGDYDNDTDIDVFMADTPDHHNDLYKFDNITKTFQDIGEAAGLHWDTISWGSLWIDHDCDMIQELYVLGEGNIGTTEILNNFYSNNGDDTFTSIREEVGLGEDIHSSYTVAMGDIGNDGYPDFMQNNSLPSLCQLWENDGGSNNYLKVKVEGSVSNRQGLGSWIRCHAGDVIQTRYTFCGENYMSQDSDYEFFGLGDVEVVDSLVVTFLSGHRDVLYDVAVNQHLTIIEGSSLSANVLLEGNPLICPGSSLLLEAGNWNQVLWSTDQTGEELEVSTPGEYWFTATNAFGISVQSDTVLIGLADFLDFTPEVSDVSCFGLADGSIQLNFPVDSINSVSWNSGDSGITIDDLPPGTYDFSALDVNGCSYEGSYDIFEPGAFTSSLLQTSPIACQGDSSGTATIEIAGGIGMLEESLESWQSATWNDDSTQVTISGFAPGLQIYTILDETGCVTSGAFFMTEPDTPLEAWYSSTSVSCFGGSDGEAQVDSISGGELPYVISWDVEVDPFNLFAGEYEVLVSDGFGCQLPLYIEILQPDELTGNLEVTGINDEGLGSAEVTIEGGTQPYNIEWSSGEEDVLEIDMLDVGDYGLSITDSLGCTLELDFVITGLDEEGEHFLLAYPNPFSDWLSIQGSSPVLRLEILSLSGQMVEELSPGATDLQVNLSHLAAGTYLLRMESAYGSTSRLLVKSDH